MSFGLTEAVAFLRRATGTLRAQLEGLAEAWVRASEGPGTWSPRDVVAHLLHGERTDWIPRARIILAQGPERRFAPFDREAHLRGADRPATGALLDALAQERAASLATLEGWRVPEADLDLVGEHPEFGPVTLRQLLATWVAHDLGHLVQVSRTMARRYGSAVGPWRAYLSVLA